MPAKPTTRAHQKRFIARFDSLPGSTVQSAVSTCLLRYGLDWLTDEQLSEITSDVVENETRRRRNNALNRRIYAEASRKVA